MVQAVKDGYPQREIADAAFELQREVDAGRRTVVGVNSFTEGDDAATPILRIDPALEGRQVQKLRAIKASRDLPALERALAELKVAAQAGRNLMPVLIDAARVHASEGEIVQALQTVWGGYRELPAF